MNERDELRKVIGTYKENREGIFQSYVFPIGDEPNNASWTGFQICDPDKDYGYLMIFRELHNDEQAKKLSLSFVQNKQLKITDLEREVVTVRSTGNEGELDFSIADPADYLFLKYEIISQ